MEIQREQGTKKDSKNDARKPANHDHQGPMVKGANLWQHFNVRCPACSKLYRIDSKEIKSSQPHFECVTCDTKFTFDFPPQNLAKIETRAISVSTPEIKENSSADVVNSQDSSMGSLDGVQMRNASLEMGSQNSMAQSPNLKKCPKCGSANPALNTECVKCQVIFDRVENLPMDAKLGAFPSLVKAWQELFSDYDNLKKHLAFVDRCEDLQALPFALKKYQALKEAQPHDPVAQRMLIAVTMKTKGLQRIHAKLMKTGLITIGSAWATHIPWLRVRKLAPWITAAGFMLYGLSNAGARNLIGIGVAVIFLTIGMTIFIKGRISAEDFW